MNSTRNGPAIGPILGNERWHSLFLEERQLILLGGFRPFSAIWRGHIIRAFLYHGHPFGGKLLQNRGRQKRFQLGLVLKLLDILKHRHTVQAAVHRTELVGLREADAVLTNYRLSFIQINGIPNAEAGQILEQTTSTTKPLDNFDIVVTKTLAPASPALANPTNAKHKWSGNHAAFSAGSCNWHKGAHRSGTLQLNCISP